MFFKKHWLSVILLVLLLTTWFWPEKQPEPVLVAEFQQVVETPTSTSQPQRPTSTPKVYPTCAEVYAKTGLPIKIRSFKHENCLNFSYLWETLELKEDDNYRISILRGQPVDGGTIARVKIRNSSWQLQSVSHGEILPCETESFTATCGFIYLSSEEAALHALTLTFLADNQERVFTLFFPTPTPTQTPQVEPEVIYIIETPVKHDGTVKCIFYNLLGGDKWAHPVNRLNCP